MQRFQKIKFKEIREKLQKIAKKTGEKAFLLFLILFFISGLIGGLTLYHYKKLIEKAEFELPAKTIQFDENVYREVLQRIETREKKFQEADFKTYPDPFAAPIAEIAGEKIAEGHRD